jgi:hypothetical protein
MLGVDEIIASQSLNVYINNTKKVQYIANYMQSNVTVTLSSKPDGSGYVLDIIGKNKNANNHYGLNRIPKPMISEDGASFSLMLKGNLTKFEMVNPRDSFVLLVGKNLIS